MALEYLCLSLTSDTISFLTDDIIRLRYVEIDGQLRKMIVVVKMRGGNHAKDIREYVINDDGLFIISPRRTEYAELTTGIPTLIGQVPNEPSPEPKAGGESAAGLGAGRAKKISRRR